MEALKAAGLAGVSVDEDKAKGEPAYGDRLVQDAAKLKRFADQLSKDRRSR